MRKKLKLGEILLEATSLTKDQLKEALYLQAKENISKPLGEILVEKGYVSKEDVELALGIQEGYPFISVKNYNLIPDVVKKVPKEVALRYFILPLDLIDNIMTVAVPSISEEILNKIEELGFKVRIFLGRKEEIKEALKKYFD